MFCSISGEVPSEPVVSRKTGHLYEKRLITKYLKEDGKCPISGEQMSEADLVDVLGGCTSARVRIAHQKMQIHSTHA